MVSAITKIGQYSKTSPTKEIVENLSLNLKHCFTKVNILHFNV